MILMVDDEIHTLARPWAAAVRDAFTAECVHAVDSADSALMWLAAGNTVEIATIDMAMPPGPYVTDSRHDGGTRTGELLIAEILIRYPQIALIALSNVPDSALQRRMEAQGVKFCTKWDVLPAALVAMIELTLRECRTRGYAHRC